MFTHLKKIIHSPSFIERHKTSPQDFTRKRVFSFPTLLFFLLNLVKNPLQTELDSYFQIRSKALLPVRLVSKAAFCKARKKFSYKAFCELNLQLLHFFQSFFSPLTWQGFRLLAFDGSTLHVPNNPDTYAHFGGQPNCPMARISQCYDLLNRFSLDVTINPYSVDERELALAHGSILTSNDLILMDRGYPAFWFFA